MAVYWDAAGIDVDPEDAAYAADVVVCGEFAQKHNTINLVKRCLAHDVPGDFVECGVNAGGHPALMAYALSRYGTEADVGRRVHLFDSFAGHPQASVHDCKDYQDQLGLNLDSKRGVASGVFIATIDQVRSNMRAWKVDEARLIYHPGWLQEVLPPIAADFPPIAVLRVDVDLHDSTVPVFEYLYDKVSPGGYIISDDWGEGSLDQEPQACRKAVHDFFARRGLPPPSVVRLARAQGTVWWKKS